MFIISILALFVAISRVFFIDKSFLRLALVLSDSIYIGILVSGDGDFILCLRSNLMKSLCLSSLFLRVEFYLEGDLLFYEASGLISFIKSPFIILLKRALRYCYKFAF